MDNSNTDTAKKRHRLTLEEQEVRAKANEAAAKQKVNVLPPIEAGASCFNENSATDSKELRRLTLSPQA